MKILKAETEADPSILDNELMIATEYEGDQYTHDLSPINDASAGMDWTNGKYILYSSDKIKKIK